MPTADTTLIRKLDDTLRARSSDLVDRALEPVLHQASAPIIKALSRVTGGDNRAAMAAVELHIADALSAIARDAKESAYQAMVTRAINYLATGQDFPLN